MSRTVLVTGGAGFIGSHLVRTCSSAGPRRTRPRQLLHRVGGATSDAVDDVEVVEGDLRSYERAHNAVQGRRVRDPPRARCRRCRAPCRTRSRRRRSTSTGTLNVLLAARDDGVRRVVLASSSSVYGNGGRCPSARTHAARADLALRVSPSWPPSGTRAPSPVYDLETVSLRYFNVFGPRQDPTSQYAAWSRASSPRSLRGRPVTRLRRRRAVARLHLRRQRRRGQCACRRRSRRRG